MGNKVMYDTSLFTVKLGSGADRIAYYSHTYNLVLKHSLHPWGNNQSEAEKQTWDRMTSDERKLFPVVKFFKQDGDWMIIMEKVTIVDKFGVRFSGYEFLHEQSRIRRALKAVNISTRNYRAIYNLAKKYDLNDLHCHNIAVNDNNDLVIIDLGL